MEVNNIAVGTDIEEVERFKNKTPEKAKRFLNLIYTEKEIEYCFSDKNSAQHLAVRFCGKEAVVKALSEFEIKDVYYKDIEILNRENKSPYVVIKKYPDLNTRISLSHSKKYATATAIIIK